MNKLEKKQMMETFIRIINHISNKDYQEKAWIKGEGADFTETVCLFFDIGDPILKKYKEYNLSEEQYAILVQFRSAFGTFADNNEFPPDFIDTPEWASIMEQAKEVLEAFHYQKE